MPGSQEQRRKPGVITDRQDVFRLGWLDSAVQALEKSHQELKTTVDDLRTQVGKLNRNQLIIGGLIIVLGGVGKFLPSDTVVKLVEHLFALL